jgi:hypothetical protein
VVCGVLTTLACFTLGVAAKKLGANFEHFWLVVSPQVTNKCYNIDVMILINAGTLAPRVANWSPKFNGISFFQPWGQYKAILVQHLLATLG